MKTISGALARTYLAAMGLYDSARQVGRGEFSEREERSPSPAPLLVSVTGLLVRTVLPPGRLPRNHPEAAGAVRNEN
jgi:hypothetical protein